FEFEDGSGNGITTSASFDPTMRLIVVRLDFSSSPTYAVRMWIDPPLNQVPPDGSAGGGAAYGQYLNKSLSGCFDRFRIQAGNGSSINVDELRIGNTFDSVVLVQPPTVTIAASPSGAICPGTSVTFTATPGNAGP